MKVLIICGSYPPQVCGIGDYTERLVDALLAEGISVTTLRDVNWDLRAIGRTAAAIRRSGCDVIHLQYPSEGYGEGYATSIVPQLLCMRFAMIVTLHEFFHSRLPRRLACIPFILFAKHLIFTSSEMRERMGRLFPWTWHKSSVVPIGTSILPELAPAERRYDEIVYFGLLTPNKGLEEVLDLARLAQKDRSGIGVHIIGAIVPRIRNYAEQLMDTAKDLPVRWTLDQPPQEVAKKLVRASVAYLPFPDGASERRSSLKALLSSGVVCVTTEGPQTPAGLHSAVVFSSSTEDAYQKAKALLANQEACEKVSIEARRYAESFCWDTIAKLHRELYGVYLTESVHKNRD